MRFKLLAGKHTDKTGKYDSRDPKRNIITTTMPLDRRFGTHRFLRLPDVPDESEKVIRENEIAAREAANAPKPEMTPEAQAAEDAVATVATAGGELSAMAVGQLRSYAEGLEIDLSGALTRDKMIEVIQAAGG